MRNPDDTQPPAPLEAIGAREYGLPSCPACYNMAKRRGFYVGQEVVGGRIEAIQHTTDGTPVALVVAPSGFINQTNIPDLEAFDNDFDLGDPIPPEREVVGFEVIG